MYVPPSSIEVIIFHMTLGYLRETKKSTLSVSP